MAEIPRIPTFTLKGIDAKIQILQTTLGEELPWLQYSFGKAERHEKEVDGETIVFPTAFIDNTSDPIDLRPNDNYISYAFWDVIDPGDLIYPEDEQYSVVKYADWEYDVALIIWADVDRIDSGNKNETKAKMRQDIIDVFETKLIGKNVMFQSGEIFDRNVDQIFLGYNLENKEGLIKWPFVGFRVNAVIRFNRECPVDNSYSV